MPSENGTPAFGDVVLVPFPFTDQSASNRRPAVVISGADYAAARPDVILMPITSQLRSAPESFDVQVEEWESAGLLKPSAVKPLIATLEQPLIVRHLGALQDADQQAVRRLIERMLG